MDIVWVAALVVLWVAMVELVVGLYRLDRPAGERGAHEAQEEQQARGARGGQA